MPTMTKEEREAFLADLHVGVIAVERPDRAPLAVPIWYAYEPGGEVVVWTDTGSVKEKLIRAAGRFSLTAQVEQPPYRYVTVEGPVTAIEPATVETARPLRCAIWARRRELPMPSRTFGPDRSSSACDRNAG